MDNFYFAVLKKLSISGIHQITDVSDLTSTYFSDQNNAADTIHSSVNKAIDLWFEEMKSAGHILSYKNNTPDDTRFDSEGKYISKIKIEAKISVSGYLFYKENRRNKWNRRIAWMAIGISFVSLCLAMWNAATNYLSSQQKLEKQQKENKASQIKKL